MKRVEFLKSGFNSVIGISSLSILGFKSNNYDLSNDIKSVVNVYDYGAVGNGRKLDTKAIQQAIDACHKGGGGTVVFPYGNFLTGTLFLKDHVFLKLESSATILGSTRLSDYDPQNPHLIYAKDVQHTGILGDGYINGQGEAFWKGKDYPYHRPGACIEFETSKQISLKGITVTNSPGWTVFLTRCDSVRVDGITILNDHDAPNTDGIDPISSSNVFISNCYINTGDDAICLKAGRSKPCENVVVTNCVLCSNDSAIKCGTSHHGNIRHCVFSNIVIRNSKYGITFFVKDNDSAYEYIQFSNISIETIRFPSPELIKVEDKSFLTACYPIFMDIEPRTSQSGLGSIRDIIFENIIINTWNGNCLILGWEDKHIENISMENIRMRVHSRFDYTGRTKPRGTRTLTKKAANDFADIPAHFTFANIDNLTLKNVMVEDVGNEQKYKRHAIWGDRVVYMDLNSINHKSVSVDHKISSIELKDCKNVFIKESRAPVSDSPFIMLKGEGCENVNVIGNDFSQAKQGTYLDNVDKKILFESANRKPNKETTKNE